MNIKIHNLTKRIKDNTVLDNVNLELQSGTVYGFKGVNGSGKTMLMRAICGLIYPSSGYVEIDGKVLGKDIYRSRKSESACFHSKKNRRRRNTDRIE